MKLAKDTVVLKQCKKLQRFKRQGITLIGAMNTVQFIIKHWHIPSEGSHPLQEQSVEHLCQVLQDNFLSNSWSSGRRYNLVAIRTGEHAGILLQT